MDKQTIKHFTTKELIEELKRRGKSSKEIFKFLNSCDASDTKSEAKSDIKETVTDILREIGMYQKLDGYHYLRYAIILVTHNPKYLKGITNELYSEIAKEFHTTSSCIDRDIRYAIEVAWNKGKKEIWQEYFGNAIIEKPKNKKFIETISSFIMIKYIK